jgi:2'-5' RNA ligase
MKNLDFKDPFYSLWLMPEDPEPFQTWINNHNQHLFPPHLTIVTKLDKEDVKKKMFDDITSLLLIPRRLHFADSITMTLFVEFCLDIQLWNLRNHALDELGILDNERPFNPHLSLFYGELNFKEYKMKKSLYDQQLPEKVRFNKIWLQKIHRTPDNWKTKDEFILC